VDRTRLSPGRTATGPQRPAQVRADRDLLRQATRLEALHSIDRDILSAKSLEELAGAALSRVRDLVPCHRATLATFDLLAREAVLFVVDINGQSHLAEGSKIPLEESAVLDALRAGDSFLARDLFAMDHLIPPLQTLRSEGLCTFLIFPMASQGQLLGSLSVSSREPDAFGDGDAVVVHEVADQLAIAISQSRLRERERERTAELEQLVHHLRRSDDQRRALLSRLVRAQEEERARIAVDVHDDSVQTMTAVGMRLATLRRRVSDPESLTLIAHLEQTVANSIGQLRRLLFDLHPGALDTPGGLATVLGESLDRLKEETGATVTFLANLGADPPAEARAICYRIAQEALANVRKHAKAAAVELLMETRDRGVHVRLHDDGIGFSPRSDDTHAHGHLGLASMIERAEMAGGWCRVDGEGGSGTTVEFWLPGSGASTPSVPVTYAI